MQPANLADAPRCGATTRSGAACQSPPVKGKRRCRMHGGTNPGAPKGNRNAWKPIRATDRDLRLLAKFNQSLKLRTTEMDRLIELLNQEAGSTGAMRLGNARVTRGRK